jgi:hypothetical protein
VGVLKERVRLKVQNRTAVFNPDMMESLHDDWASHLPIGDNLEIHSRLGGPLSNENGIGESPPHCSRVCSDRHRPADPIFHDEKYTEQLAESEKERYANREFWRA